VQLLQRRARHLLCMDHGLFATCLGAWLGMQVLLELDPHISTVTRLVAEA